ncbi:antirestriction protein [Burkholderia pseudomallei]|uniref:antirestriction protein n=1 Tax=Burkholderia pseudomallei TaxID=28450 RepID=UPI00053898BB|nr:antirestriction protein [Burkholderia pseudomallei]KGW11929.1 klcA [Burkholderia pseudomallei MSHR4000]
MEQNESLIACERVSDEGRLAFLPHHLGLRFLSGETLVYEWARRLSSDYDGGSWAFYTLSNGGFYVAPELAGPVSVSWSLNYFEGEMSADAFGIVVTLFALCHLCEKYGDDLHAEKFHLLREFAAGHSEQGKIFAAID